MEKGYEDKLNGHLEGYLRVLMYQKGIMATYLRVLMYQKGIMATYLRVLMYQKGIMAHYQDIVLNFKVLRYLRVLMYQKGIMEPYHYLSEWGFMEQYIQAYFQDNKLYRSMRMLDTYSCLHYLRVLLYQEGIMAHYLRVPMYQEGIMAHYLRVPMYQEGIMDHYLRGVMEMAQVVIQKNAVKHRSPMGDLRSSGSKVMSRRTRWRCWQVALHSCRRQC